MFKQTFNVFLYVSLFIFFQNSAMETGVQNFDSVLCETALIIGEMCYRKRVDLNNEKEFHFHKPYDTPRCVIFSCADYEANNIFEAKEWEALYSDGFKKLLQLWNSDNIQTSFKLNNTLKLLDIVKILSQESKEKLLNHYTKYKPSCIKFIGSILANIGLALSGVGLANASYNQENKVIKLGMVPGGLFVLLSIYNTIKIASEISKERNWWKRCCNFHQAIELCSKKVTL